MKMPPKRPPRCAYCKAAIALPKGKRGRPPRYCKPSHRQRDFERRRQMARASQILTGRDLYMAQVQGMEQRVLAKLMDTLEKSGALPPPPKAPRRKPKKPSLRLVK